MLIEKTFKIQIVIPIFNEAKTIKYNLARIMEVAKMTDSACTFHLLLVDDGSQDKTCEALSQFCDETDYAKFISFTRNFGKEAAIEAGLKFVDDDIDAVILMDCDLQHPPELIPQMIQLWHQNFKVVEAFKVDRGNETIFNRFFATGFYKLFDIFAGLDIKGQCDYKLLDRCVVEEYCRLQERGRFFRGLIQWMNYSTARIPFEVPDRAGGTSRWGKLKLVKYALRNITSFSALPLQLVTWGGIISLIVGGIFGSITLIQKLEGNSIDGFTTVILLLVFFSGVLMLSLGVIGHYISVIYEEIKFRPSYIIDYGVSKKRRGKQNDQSRQN